MLAVQAKAGIAAVEKLLPDAIAQADFSKTEIGQLVHTWKDVHPATQKEVYEKFISMGKPPEDVSAEQWHQWRIETWNRKSEDEKFLMLDYTGIWARPGEHLFESAEPAHWTTGVKQTRFDDAGDALRHMEDYARTHAIALKLTELRTDELRKERGLMEPRPKPEYEVVEGYSHTPEHPNYLVKTKTGRLIAASNTKEQAIQNAERLLGRGERAAPRHDVRGDDQRGLDGMEAEVQ